MESIHGVLEWFILLALIAAGFAVDRFAPRVRGRYLAYAGAMLAAFIFDLNGVSFRHDAANAALYLSVMVIIVEVFLFCARKKSRLLFGGAFVLLVPVFLYAYAALLLAVPLPCHGGGGAGVVGRYEACDGGRYALRRRLSFDPFGPARVYELEREIRHTPLKKRVDKYRAPDGYLEAWFSPRWECMPNGRARVDLITDGYALWSLLDKNGEK
jgi:hypothetical protein